MLHKISFLRFFRKLPVVIGGIFIPIILGGLLYAISLFFSVRTVELHIQNPSLVLVGITELNNQNMFLLNDQKTVSDLVKRNPQVKSITLKKKHPSTVVLTVSTLTPYVQFEVSQGYFVLSASGRILEKKRDVTAEIPIIHYYQKYPFDEFSVGDMVDFKDVTSSMQFYAKLTDIGETINSIDIGSFDMIACNGEDKTFVFSSNGDVSLQAYQLETIVRRFKIEGKEFVKLDLRFDKPVIELKK